jgi:hypothetical protein
MKPAVANGRHATATTRAGNQTRGGKVQTVLRRLPPRGCQRILARPDLRGGRERRGQLGEQCS